MNEFIWIGILIIAFITEISTAALVAVWFMPGALVSLILAALDVRIWVQVLVFSVISVIMLALSRSIFKKYIRKKPIIETNADSLVGNTAIVVEDIDNIEGTGQIKISSQIWTARSEEDTIKIEQGSIVKITKIEGVKLICKIIDKE